MSFLFSLLPALIVLGILIMIHEYGHFLACRLSKVRVEKFSIGFGPEILSFKTKATNYVISLLPLGGFVKPAGESLSELEGQKPEPGDYLAAPLASRIFIVVAGVLMNYFLAFVLFVGIFLSGRPIPGTTIGGLIENYPAISSGLAAGDKILKVDEVEVKTWTDLIRQLSESPSGELTLLADRAGQTIEVKITPKVEIIKNPFGQDETVRRIGIKPNPQANVYERYGFFGAVKKSWQTCVGMTVMTHQAIFHLILGKLSLESISGPVGIISMTGDAARLGLPYLIQLMATLSISLAVINLLPIPALDGGHLLFLLIEGVRKKPVSLKTQEIATQIGFMLLLALMVFIIYNDFANMHLFNRIKEWFTK